MLDYFKHEKNLTDAGNVVDKVDIRGHVIAECDAALKDHDRFKLLTRKG